MPALRSHTYDASGLFEALGTKTAANAGAIVDLGGTGETAFEVLMDVTTCAVDGGDEAYTFNVFVSNDPLVTGGSTYHLIGSFSCGDAAVLLGDADIVSGRFRLGLSNVVNGVGYRYVQCNLAVVGATVSINYQTYMVKPQAV